MKRICKYSSVSEEPKVNCYKVGLIPTRKWVKTLGKLEIVTHALNAHADCFGPAPKNLF